MHAVLYIQKVVFIASLNESVEEGCWTFKVEAVNWAQLLLVTYHYKLLWIVRSGKVCQVFSHHCRFIDQDSFKLAVTQSFGTRLTYCCDDDFALLQNVLLKVVLFLNEIFELVSFKFFNPLDVMAQIFYVLLLKLKSLFPDEIISFSFFIIFHFDNHRILHYCKEVIDGFAQLLNFWEFEDYNKLDPAIFIFLSL